MLSALPRRRRNACSNCREHGHTINHCAHPSVQALVQEVQHAINYSIGYDHQAYINTWLENLNVTQLRILAYKYNITPPDIRQRLNVIDTRLYYIERLIHATYTSQPREAIDRKNARDILSGEQLIDILETIEIWVVRNTLLLLHNSGSDMPRPINIMQPTPIQTIYHQGAVIRRNIRDVNHRRVEALRIINDSQAQLNDAQAQLNELNNTRANLIVAYNSVEYELNQLIENINIEPRKFDIVMVNSSTVVSQEELPYTKAIDCPICYDVHPPENIITTNCNHVFCSPCLVRSFDIVVKTISKHPTCAMCRESIVKLTFNNNPVILKEMKDKFCA